MDIQKSGSPAARSAGRAATASGNTPARPSPADPPATRPTPPVTLSDPGDAKSINETPDAPQTEIARRVKLGSIASDRETLLRGRRAFERGDDDAALESFSRLASHGVRYADVHYMTGLLQERRGEVETALVSLKEAVRINPSYVEALLALASLHEHRGEYESSQGYAERASELSRAASGDLDATTRGKLANQQATLADALAQAGERREAIEEYRRALDRCPTFHDIRHRLGITLREAGLPAQAAQEFRRILRAHPGLLESQVQLGLTYYSIGRTPEAIREWDAVLEKDPSRDEARMYLRLVRGSGRNPAAATTPPSVDEVETDPVLENAEELSFASIRSPAPPGASTAARPPLGSTPGWSKTELSRTATEGDPGDADA